MNCMRTTTSNGPISVAEDWTAAELLNAGWSEADLEWERLTAGVAEALAAGDRESAKQRAGQAVQVARADFEGIDPRLGTSLANYALRLPDDAGARLMIEARSVWAACGPWIDRLQAPRVARSSLFHMRMEQRSRDTYQGRWREKWAELAEEAKARIAALADGTGGTLPAGVLCGRWRRECPAMLNDTRKLMAAVILLAPGA